MSLHSSSSVSGEGSTPKDPLYKILDELRSLKFWNLTPGDNLKGFNEENIETEKTQKDIIHFGSRKENRFKVATG